MKREGLHKIVVISVILTILAACTAEEEENVKRVPITLIPYASTNVEIATRSLPTGYVPYIDLYPQPQIPQSQIGVYFVHQNSNHVNVVDPLGTFSYSESNHGWVSTVGVIPGLDYKVFGFHPAVGLENNSQLNYTNPSQPVLTLPTMKAVSAIDVCVVVGVAKGSVQELSDGPVPVPIANSSISLGIFDYAATLTNNYIYLLVDHLFSCVNFEFKIEDKYQELRDIRLRKVEIKSTGAEKVNITVNLTPNAEGTNPITNVAYSPVVGSGSSSAEIYDKSADDGDLLQVGTALAVPGYFLPPSSSTSTEFEMITTYDVLDKKGEVVRSEAEAKNTFTIGSVTRGQKYTVKVRVAPTYLYQLSDNDLNNPSFTIN